MKRIILVALLAFGVSAFAACSGGTHTCTATGLTPGSRLYSYYGVDSDGNEYSGEFRAEGPTYDVPNVPGSIDCSTLQVDMYQLPYNLA